MHLYVEETATEIYTFVSHSIGEYGSDLLAKVKRQLGFKNHQQFEDFLNCPMSFEEYVKMLAETGKINLYQAESKKTSDSTDMSMRKSSQKNQ